MIFYFHGFSSGAQSQKATVIKSYFVRQKVQLIVPEYPSHNPNRSIKILKECINQHVQGQPFPVMLMGSSLGGYYAQFLATQYECVERVVLINPCLQPQLILSSQLGTQVNCVTRDVFQFTRNDLESFEHYDVREEVLLKNTLVLIDEGDELIDPAFAVIKYRNKGRVIVYPGGDHWFRHLDKALPEIDAFYHSAI